jgi:hypothetical protein
LTRYRVLLLSKEEVSSVHTHTHTHTHTQCDAIEAHCLDIFEKAFATARKNIEMRKKNDSRPPLMSSWQVCIRIYTRIHIYIYAYIRARRS